MRTESIIANLRALIRANAIMAEMHARAIATRSGVAAFAGFVAAFGLVMFGLAAFFALEQQWGPIWAAVTVGAACCVIALILALIAMRIAPGRDIELARDVHNKALEGLAADGRAMEAELAQLRYVVTHPFEAILPGVVVPLTGIVLNILKKRGEPKAPRP
jgi:hypothetical protein